MTDYKIEVTEVSEVERDIKVVIPQAAVEERLEAVLKNVAQTASIKGFRKGKVPMSVVRKMYFKQALKDVEADLVQEGFSQATNRYDLAPLALPKVNRPDYKGEGDYVFSFTMELKPVVKDVVLDGFEVERERVVVSDEAMEQALEGRRQSAAVMKTVEGRDTIEKDDWVRMDYEGFIQGEPLPDAKAEKQEIQLGEDRFIPGFEEHIIGQKIGEPLEFSVAFPEDFRVEHLKGAEITFKCFVHEILERELPELDDELAKDLGEYANLDELKADLKKDLENAQVERVKRQFQRDMWKKIVAANPMPLPPSVLAKQTEEMMKEQANQMAQYGLDPASMGMDEAAMRERAQEEAEHSLKSVWLQERLAKDFDITVSDEDREAYMTDMAEKMQLPLDQLMKYYADPEKMDTLTYVLRQDRLNEMLAEKVAIKEVDPKPIQPANAPESDTDDEPESAE